MLYRVALTFECVDEILKCDDKAKEVLLSLCTKSLSVTTQMKAIGQYFPVVLFIMLYNVIETFESLGKKS